ncbi:MAG: hypothetical protein SFW67_34730 [Myxococcaceae bacterium]|nr:hypothetical protein [Myxococcaceae bacterium]
MRIKPPSRRPPPPPPQLKPLRLTDEQAAALQNRGTPVQAPELRSRTLEAPPETPEFQQAAAEQIEKKFELEAAQGPVDAAAVGRALSSQLHGRLADQPAGVNISAVVLPGDRRSGISQVEADTLRRLQQDPRVTPSGSQAIEAFIARTTRPPEPVVPEGERLKPGRLQDGIEERRKPLELDRAVPRSLRQRRDVVRSVGTQARALEASRAESTGEPARAPKGKAALQAKGKAKKEPVTLDAETREKYLDVLKSIGVPDKFLAKASDKSLVDNIARVEKDLASGKGQIKTKFKKFTVTSKFNPEGELVDVKVKKKVSGFKKALGAILKVASFIPGPIGVVARTVSAVQGGVAAIRGGNLLGGIAGVLGGVSGLGQLGGAAGRAFSGIANGAGRIANTIGRVGNAVDAIRNRDLGGLLGSIGGNSPGLNRLASIANGVQAARNGDIGGALGALGSATGNERLGQVGGAVSAIQNRDFGGFIGAVGGLTGNQGLIDFGGAVGTAQAIRAGIRSGDFGAVAEAFAGFAGSRATTPQQQDRVNFVSGVIQAFGEIRAERRSNEQALPLPQTEGLAQALEAAGLGALAGRLRAANDNVEAAMETGDAAAMEQATQRLDETLDAGLEEFTDAALPPTG